MHPYRISLTAFLATVGIFVAIVLSCLWLEMDRLPGPRISDSVSFNQKALWLRHAYERDPSVDILIVGSSMGLLNVDGSELAKVAKTNSIWNASSWALPVSESCRLMEELLKVVHPKMVILPVYYKDFYFSRIHDFDWKKFHECVVGRNLFPLYIENMDLLYYVNVYFEKEAAVSKTRRIFDSLNFDSYGGAPLSSTGFLYVQARWNWYQIDTVDEAEIDPDNFTALKATAEDLKKRKIDFVLLVCPMRQPAEKKLAADAEALLWGKARKIVEDAGGRYVHVAGGPDFDDGSFTDSYHLNEVGSRKVADRLAPVARTLQPSGPAK